MKKYFKTYTKKSLALFMTVMMLMSCWVFVAPEHNHASAVSAETVAATNQATIKGLSGSTTINGTSGAYFPADGGDNYDVKAADVYKNVAWSDNVTSGKYAGGVTDQKVQDSKDVAKAWIFYPTTVLMYDGETTPQMGVTFLFHMSSGNGDLYHSGTYMTSPASTSLVLAGNWHANGTLSSGESPYFLKPWSGSNVSAGYGATEPPTKYDSNNYYSIDKGDLQNLANVIQYKGSLTGDKYSESFTPTFKTYFDRRWHVAFSGDKNKQGQFNIECTLPIYIIRTDTLKKAYAEIDSYKSLVQGNYSKYSTESVAKFVELANALMAVNPNAITWETSTATRVENFATDAKAAVDAWNAWSGLELAEYTVSCTSSNGLWSGSVKVKYGETAQITCPEKNYDENSHYTFKNWYEGEVNNEKGNSATLTVENVTDDRAFVANYGSGEAHSFTGTVTKATDTTHKIKCSSCEQTKEYSCNFVDYTPNGDTHTASCSAGCGNTSSHTANWIEEPKDQYMVEADKTANKCEKDIRYYKHCEDCDIISTEFFVGKAKTGHNYVHVEALDVAHTCITNGKWGYKCENCSGEIKSEFKLNSDGTSTNELADEKAHSLSFSKTVSPTCTEKGYDLYVCSKCDYTEKRNEVYASGHQWGTELKEIDKDYHGYYCTVCETVYNEATKTEHKWGETKVDVKPTCVKEGSGTQTCSDCGATKTVTIAVDKVNGHSYSEKPVSDGNGKHSFKCTNEGCGQAIVKDCERNDKCQCSDCGYQFEHQYTAETVDDSTKATDATCEKSATYYYSCSVCGDINKSNGAKTFESGTPLGHDWENTTDEGYLKDKKTCESDAVYYQKCSRCDVKDAAHTYTAIGTAIGHDFDGGVAVNNQDGTHSFKCKNDGCDATGVGTEKNAFVVCTYGEYETVDGTNHKHTCTACGYVEEKTHDFTNWTHVEGEDKHTRKCNDCSYTETENCNLQETNYDATCEAPAKVGKECKICGNNYLEDVVGSVALGHDWGEWKSNGDGTHTKTCSRDASHTETENCSGGKANCTDKKTCEVCHEKYGEALGHEMTHNEKVDATCEKAGTLENYYCSRCEKCFADENGETKLDSIEIAKLDHSYIGEVKSNGNGTHSLKCVNGCGEYGEAVNCSGGEATCTNKAVCSVCHEEYGEALGHEMTNNEKVDATCKDAGTLENYYCSRCEKHFADKKGETELDSIEITKLDHSYTGEVKSNGNGTHSFKCVNGCGEYGEAVNCSGGTAYCDEEAICGICGQHYGDKDPDRHKSNTHHDGLAATCMQEGYTAYEQCDKCNKFISGHETIVIDPTNHNFVGATAARGENHKHTVQCQNKDVNGKQCEEKQEFDCSLSATFVVTAPTCTKDGYTTYTCSVCGNTWTADQTPANGHTWSDWKFDEDSEEKEHYKVCTVEGCGVKDTVTGSCEENATTETVAATCTEGGYTLHTCNVCGRTWKTDETKKANHKYDKKTINDEHKVDGDTFASSCTQEQFYWYDCSVCGKNAKDEEDTTTYPESSRYYQNGTAKGHTWEGMTVKEGTVLASKATCTENAFYYIYCTKCGLSTNQLLENDEFYNATFEDFGSSRGYHDYQNIVNEEDLTENRVSGATCSAKAVYYKSCVDCGAVSHETFEYGDYGTHSFTKQVKDAAHRISVANCKTPATYWYSCEYCELNAKLYDKTGMDEDAIDALKFSVGTTDPSNHIGLVDVAPVEATCSSAGHSAYQNCIACGTNDIGKTVYAQKDHDFSGACTPATDDDGNVISGKHSIACKYGCKAVKVVDCEFGQWKQDENAKTHTRTCICGNSETAECVSSGAATCDKAETCVDCGRVIKAALNHKWSAWTSNGDGTHTRVCENDASHTETQNCHGGDVNGCGAIYCDDCDANYATGTTHTWGEWKDVKAATCTTKATHKRQCTACLEWSEEVEYGSVKGHDWDSGTVNTPATCTTAGEMLYKCKNDCGETKTEVIKSLGHEYDAQWTVIEEATCKDEGKKVKYCTHSWVIDGKTIKCDSVKEMTIPADKTKHVESDWIVDETTGSCATGLTKKKVCTVCGVKLDETTEPIAHDWERAHVTKGTCTANGYINMVCKNCQAEEVFDDTCVGFPYKFDGVAIENDIAESLLSKGGHAWRTEALEGEENYTVIDGKIVYIDKDSTCSQTGRGKMHCANCGEVSDTVTIAKKDHKFKDMPASPATCQTPGYEAYQACENCPYTTPQVRIEALGHEDLNDNGKCDRCGFEMYQTPDGGTNACACICHKNSFFISKIIYPIARFFWKIFKINHSCSCGKTHY